MYPLSRKINMIITSRADKVPGNKERGDWREIVLSLKTGSHQDFAI